MPALKPHLFKIGTKAYKIKLPDVYDNTSHTVGKAFGLKLITPDVAAENRGADSITVSSGLVNGQLVRVRISYVVGTGAAAKRRTARLVCPISEIADGINDVLSMKYKGIEVLSAGIPRRRRLG